MNQNQYNMNYIDLRKKHGAFELNLNNFFDCLKRSSSTIYRMRFFCRFVRLCALINQTFETKTHSERIFWIFDNLTKKQKMNINWIIFSNQTQANLQNASQFAKRKPNRNVQKAWANTAPIKYSINNLYWWHFLDKIWQTVIFSYFQKWLLKFF